jgi:hypothetical protein
MGFQNLTLKSQSLQGVPRLVERGSPKYMKATFASRAEASVRAVSVDVRVLVVASAGPLGLSAIASSSRVAVCAR